MDAIWLHTALHRAEASQADLARHLGLDPSAISRMVKGERQVKALEVTQIATFLGVPDEEVLRHAGTDAAVARSSEPARRGRPPGRSDTAARTYVRAAASREDDMPIRSAGRGGGDQQMFLEDRPVGYTPRPANLSGVREAYAIYMLGDSMEPRYEQGWLLHVNPFKPPVRGRDVVVYKRDQAVLIKQFIGWQGDSLVLRQLNPEATLRFTRAEVVECHMIVGVDQEG